MGQVLSEPVRDKASDKGQDSRYMYGTSSMQGWRITMEDSHACVLDLRKTSPYISPVSNQPIEEEKDQPASPSKEDSDKSEEIEKTEDTTAGPVVAFFAVYDGHGGGTASVFAGESIHQILVSSPAYKVGKYRTALKDTFLYADRLITKDPSFAAKPSGCTATVALVTEDTIYVANAGDSRSIVSLNGKAKPMSFDHKPTDPGEQSRVEQAGGRVKDGRVNEHLALSRAFGDFDFKRTGTTPESDPVSIYPDITSQKINDEVEFLVLACDGIWDCKTSQEVIDRIRKGIAEKADLDKICEEIMDECISEDFHSSSVGSDNMTITIVALLQGKTPEEWYAGIGSKVAQAEPVATVVNSAPIPAIVEVV